MRVLLAIPLALALTIPAFAVQAIGNGSNNLTGGRYDSVVLADSPAAYYEMELTSGTPVDQTGHTTGSLSGTPAYYLPGFPRTSMHAIGLGTGAYGNFTTTASPITPTTSNFTIEFLGNFPSTVNVFTICSGNNWNLSSTNMYWGFYNGSTTMNLGTNFGPSFNDYVIRYTHSTGLTEFFTNGAPSGLNPTFVITSCTGIPTFAITNGNAGEALSRVGYWTSVLTNLQIATHYAALINP